MVLLKITSFSQSTITRRHIDLNKGTGLTA